MTSEAGRPAKSPILAAIGLSIAIGVGAVLGTTDMATVEDALTGKWFMREFTETQQAHAVAIAALAHNIGNVTREIDFIAARVSASAIRNEDRSADRFAQLDAEIAALKDKLAGIQNAQLFVPRSSEEPANASGDIGGLRSSLHDLAGTHTRAVAAITRRLDRIELRLGLTTDVASAPPRVMMRRNVSMKTAKKPKVEDGSTGQSPFTERGHLFEVKPISRPVTPVRLSKLPG